MKHIAALILAFAIAPALGQGSSSPLVSATSVVPSTSGLPNSIATLWPYEFVSVQSTGQIFTYNISSGSQVLVGSPYSTPSCMDPSGMVITNIAGANIMAYVCYDANALYTATVNSNGSLTALGSVSGLPAPYPGIALDGTNVYVPLNGTVSEANGAVAKVSIATPASPTVTATTTLASPTSGVYVNPGYLAVAGGYVYVEAGSEPSYAASTIQVINESTMALVGSPLDVVHSPQYVAIQGNTAYVTFYDTPQLESINISNPASISILQTLSTPSCHSIPVILRAGYAFVGCFEEGSIEVIDITNPSDMQIVQTFTGVASPQRLKFDDQYLFATGYVTGGSVYQILTDGTYYQQIDASDIYAYSLQTTALNASSASVTNNLTVQGAALLGTGSTVAGSPICTPANAMCGISALTGDVSATGPGSAVATVTGVHATSGTLNGVTIGATTPEAITATGFTIQTSGQALLNFNTTGSDSASGFHFSVPGVNSVSLACWGTGNGGGLPGACGLYDNTTSKFIWSSNTTDDLYGYVPVTDVVAGTGAAWGILHTGAATFSSSVTTDLNYGPATAPTGSCTTNGAWVFSKDGHATFCSSGTWVTKI